MSLLRDFLRPLFNQIRKINKISFLEKFIAGKTQGKPYTHFWVKLLPSIYSYQKGSFRTVQRNGINYFLDISDYMDYILYFGITIEEKSPLYDLVQDGMYVFDVGTNIGDTLLNFAKINKNGHNFGFEPVPFLFDRAQKNISLNRYPNIHLYNLAVAEQNGKLFFEVPANRNSGSISMSSEKKGKAVEVEAISLDNFIETKQIPRVDIIKIDVEGFEPFVLAGAKNTIQKFQPTLYVEVIDEYLKRNGSSATELIATILTLGYDVFDSESFEKIHLNSIISQRLDVLCKPCPK